MNDPTLNIERIFQFIIRMCIRVWRTGEEPEDNREYDTISEEKKKGKDIRAKKE